MGKPPSEAEPTLTFVLDECIATVPAADAYKVLFGLENTRVELLVEHFGRGAKDADWLPKVAAKEWIILTKDTMIRKRRLEVEAWTRSGAVVCILDGGAVTGLQTANALAAAMPKIRRWVQNHTRPLLISISHAGHPYVKLGQRRGAVRNEVATKDKLGLSSIAGWHIATDGAHRAQHDVDGSQESQGRRAARRPSERGRTEI